MEEKGSLIKRRNQLVLVLALCSIIIISGLAFIFLGQEPSSPPLPPEPNNIGIIHIYGAINSATITDLIVESINEAKTNSSIKGVIFQVDSPGGFAHLVEKIYLDILELKATGKPVVAHVVTALSGGYYISVAADYIYTNPSSQVGNVGVIATAPNTFIPSEINLDTGPYKTTGYSKLLYPFNLSSALESFAGAVEVNRGSTLNVSSSELRKGKIYMGVEAVQLGIADGIGGLQRSARYISEQAELTSYQLVSLDYWSDGSSLGGIQTGNGVSWRNITVQTLYDLHPPPALYYLYMPSEGFQVQGGATIVDFDPTVPISYGYGQVIVDMAHGNRVSPRYFQILSGELAQRGVYMGYGDSWEEIEAGLESAACLIIAAPTRFYSADEFELIDAWLKKGRMLILLYDPSIEYNDNVLLNSPINSIANRYGLSFRSGYLYNMDQHYGIYRNIFVSTFRNTNITKNLDNLVLFTSTGLLPTDSNAGYTSTETYSTATESKGIQIPLSVIEKGNTTIVAVGDITFLTEPYLYLEDNYQFLLNMVQAISDIRVPIIEPVEEPEYNITRPSLPVGTVKTFSEWVDGAQRTVTWTRTKANETVVDRDGNIVTYFNDEDYATIGWDDQLKSVVYDEPVPDLPYPLIEDKGWVYQVGYNMTWGGVIYRGRVEGGGRVDSFEEVLAGDSNKYVCAKVLITEQEVLNRFSDTLKIYVTQYIWMSQEAGLVKAETSTMYYVDDALASEDSSTMMMTSIEK